MRVSWCAHALSTLPGTPSGPAAFLGFTARSTHLTSCSVTVSEAVQEPGRCPFRQYMLSKPARYGIKIWVVCDTRSSYAWKMQDYTSKPDKCGPPKKHLATRVVVDLTKGLMPECNVTCDNFFTSRELIERLFRERGHTVLGTLRANRPEIPRELRCAASRAEPSAPLNP
ncbi:piggyBac transposable element-derived protein 4-like [Simochromis diagramma]|uniref:piggyBac transposable element-derived protein 4-like n=1 Tax=Simochromis diagramma TaxID=43689 RepID=UPI001A7E8C83|nr:piggyBac transposable element-derived protein 4-like [Simochromis diagramma]